MPSLNMRLWLPDMERDILAPWRRVDNILWPGWGSVFLEHLMVITGDLAMGICLHVMWRRGMNWSYDQDSTAGSCHSFDLQRYPHPNRIKCLDCAVSLATSQTPPSQKKEEKKRTRIEKWNHNFLFPTRTSQDWSSWQETVSIKAINK